MKIYLKFIVLLSVLVSCSSNNIQTDKDPIQRLVKNQYWMNEKYIDCLIEQLNFDCINKNEIYAFKTDSLRGIEIYDSPIEPFYSSIFEENGGFYFLKQGDTMKIKLDSSNQKIIIGNSVFISNERWNNFDDYSFVGLISGKQVYENLPVDVKQLINEQKVSISWNSRLKLHILSDGPNCEYNKIIEYKKDSVYLYKILNNCAPKSENEKIQRELILKAKK